MVPEGDIEPELRSGAIAALLEKDGVERIITKRSRAERGTGPEAQMQGLAGAHRMLGEQQCSARFFPVWDLARDTSSCLLLQPVGGRTGSHASSVRRLLRHAGEVVTRTMLLEKVWDFHFDPKTNIVETHISRLRSKIDKGFGKPLLHTVRGAGYVIRAPD